METLILNESEGCTEGDGGYCTASHRMVFRNHSAYTIYTQVNRLLQYLNPVLSNPRQSIRMLEINSQSTPKCKRKCLYLKENIQIRCAFMSAKQRFDAHTQSNQTPSFTLLLIASVLAVWKSQTLPGHPQQTKQASNSSTSGLW